MIMSMAPCSNKTRALKALGQFLPNGLLDDGLTGKTCAGARLGGVDIAQQRKACGRRRTQGQS